jgi:chromate transport protein ChrA
MERSSQGRLSFAEEQTTTGEIYWGILRLSYLNTGDQQSHIATTHEQLVQVNKWLSETQFKEIFELCWSLPGPTTLQVMLTIVLLKFKSLTIAANCFLVYNCIPWVVLTVMGAASSYCLSDQAASRPQEMVLMGLNAAAAGIMVRNFITYFSQTLWNWPKMLLILLSAAIFCCYQTIPAVTFCLCLGAATSLYLEIE